VKFISFYQYKVEDQDKIMKKFAQIQAERAKDPTKFPKIIFGPFGMGEFDTVGATKCFTIHEVDDMKQFLRLGIHFTPEITWKFVPIMEASEFMPLWQEMKH